MARMTQKELILRHLKDGHRISSAICFSEYGFTDLQSIIRTLRDEGYPILDQWCYGTNRYKDPVKWKEYWLGPPKDLLAIIQKTTKE